MYSALLLLSYCALYQLPFALSLSHSRHHHFSSSRFRAIRNNDGDSNKARLPKKDGLLDWDCVEALDVPKMAESLAHISKHGVFPPDHDSKEDRNSISACPVPGSTIAELKVMVEKWSSSCHVLDTKRLCILDGFLMYPPSMSAIHPYLSLKLFVRTSHASCKARREARDGYATVEGWWVDPPGYVDKIVWPNYVRDHGFMFENGDVEGKYRKDVLGKEGIRIIDGEKERDMVEMLRWVVQEVMEAVEMDGKDEKRD